MNTVTQEHITAVMEQAEFEVTKLGTKSTVVCATLPNGFQIVESASCVDPANYDHEMGLQIAKDRIEKRLWELEGYLLQQRLSEGQVTREA